MAARRQEVAWPWFDHTLGLHHEIPNPQRAEGKLYEPGHVQPFLT
jgi:hypothetical protein